MPSKNIYPRSNCHDILLAGTVVVASLLGGAAACSASAPDKVAPREPSGSATLPPPSAPAQQPECRQVNPERWLDASYENGITNLEFFAGALNVSVDKIRGGKVGTIYCDRNLPNVTLEEKNWDQLRVPVTNIPSEFHLGATCVAFMPAPPVGRDGEAQQHYVALCPTI